MRGRRAPWPVLVVLLVTALLVTAIVLSSGSTSGRPLAPDNPGPQGSQALARVLQAHGVSVEQASNLDALRRAHPGTDTSVIVTAPVYGSDESARRLIEATSGTGSLVLVSPSPRLLDQVLPNSPDPQAYSSRVWGPHRSPSGTQLTIVNDPAIVQNRSITQGDNAALALRATGAHHRVIWVSSWNSRSGGSGDAGKHGLHWPAWKTPLVFALLATTLVLAFTRGKRFGRLVVEPLPVTVKAVESTEALASLYHRSHARRSAAQALQDATRRRLAARLGLPARSEATDVAAALPPGLDASALTAPTPESDADLAALAHRLHQLEKEMSR